MAAVGFSGAFFKDPLQKREPASGVAIYWRASFLKAVVPVEPRPQHQARAAHFVHQIPLCRRSSTFTMEGVAPGPAECRVINCGSEMFDGAAVNVDLNEHWHNKEDGVKVQLTAEDRRNVGLLKLVSKKESNIAFR